VTPRPGPSDVVGARGYRTIVADPPWHYDGFVSSVDDNRSSGVRSGAVTKPLPYPSMSLGQLADLPVGDLAARDSFLFMWTTNAYLPSAFWLTTAWGFSYRQLIVWDKGSSMSPLGGAITPNASEYLLFCRRGTPRLKGRWDAGSVVRAPKGSQPGTHSRKPEVFLDIVEQVAPGPYLEMFARRTRLGWHTWGNQALEHVELAS
jgi:N6-adenosine-specific RNA methylase IME4